MRERLSHELGLISATVLILLSGTQSALAEQTEERLNVIGQSQPEDQMTDDSGQVTHNILQFSETEQPVTSVEAWMTQVGQSLIRVTGVQVNPTETGLELVLQTDQGDLTVPTPVTVGNALIADIPNAILALPDGNEFQQYSPINGIALVTVTSYAENQVRVAITGLNAPPTAEIRTDAQQLILSLSPSSETEDEAAADEAQDSISIVVTAQKTPEDIQDVPLSVTVLTEQEIEDADITSLEEIARNVPNFSFFPSGDRSFAIYSVRGLSNSSVIASRDPVDFYIDGVPYGFASFLDVDLPELERVEVLRGPQSVLYGRNSLAGVVNLITRRPSDVLEFSGIVGYGSYNDLDLRASVSGPLIEEQLFFRLSGNYGSRDGYLRNTFLDTDVNERSGGTGRAQLLWIPSEDWEIALNASFEAYRDGASAYVPLGQSNPFETEQDVDGFNALVTNAQSLQISYNHSDFRFASITAHRFSQNDLEFDGDYTTADAVVRVLDELSTSIFSQEFRLQSPETAEHFEWLLGGYYESSQFHSVDNGFRFGNDATTLLGVPFPAGTLNLSNSGVSANTLAVFGQISYRPIDALTLTTGLRYESTTSRLESFERTLRIPGPPDLSLLSLRNIEQDGDALLPRFVIEYRFNPDMMTYGSITRGYRPPGTNFGAGSVETATYGAERSWNYEVGFKSSWLNNRLAVNLALFHNPVENFQVLSFDELGGSFTDNANVRISGLELEARATPTTGFDIIAGLGIVDARFTDFTNRFTGEDSAGNRLTFAPNITYNLAIQYRNPIGIFGRVELQGLGTTYFDDANFLKQDPYAIINARLGYERDNFGIYLFANNIFNTEYINQAFSLPPIGSIASYGTPATYGVQVRSRF